MRGDLCALSNAVLKIVEGQDDSRALSAVTAMVTLRKKKDMPMADFVAFFASQRHVLVSSGIPFDLRLQRESLLVSLTTDGRYEVEVSLARRDVTMSVDAIIDSVLVKSRAVELLATKNVGGLFGMAADATSPKSKALCFSMRDKGSCRFGDKCRFSHGGAATKPRTEQPGAGKAARGSRKCFECDGDHSISECKIFADRKTLELTLKAELAEAKAMVTSVEGTAAAVGGLALSFPAPPSGAMASMVWGSDN
jgi:hypothetical protein